MKRSPKKKKSKVLLSALLSSQPPEKRVKSLNPLAPRVKPRKLKRLVIPKKGKPPKDLVLTDKGRPTVRIADLHRDWSKLGTLSCQKRKYRFKTKDKIKTIEKDCIQLRLPGTELGQFGMHLFHDVLESGYVTTGLLYDSGFHIREKPVLKFIRKRKKTVVDISTLRKIAIDLKSCDNPEKNILQDFRSLIREAKAYYKERRMVPIIVIDVDFEMLTKSARKSLGVDHSGVLQVDNVAGRIKKKNIYAYAPLKQHFGCQKVKFVVDKRFIMTNREISDKYSFSTDGKKYTELELGEPFLIEFTDTNQEAMISISVGLDRMELAQRILTSAQTRAVPPWDLSWVPTRIVADSGPDVGRSTGITAHVFHSFNHDPAGPEIQNPIIFLGGFDEDFTSYELMYDLISAIQHPDFISILREVFDVVLLTYDDVSVSIELNARALAFTLRDIIERNENRDSMVFIGISMGGLVSRMCFAGIENGVFSSIDEALGGPILEHNTKVWITVDTPHQGAHIPLGLQYLVHSLRWIPFDEFQKIVELLDSTSAREMLIDHYESAPATDPARTEFYDTLSSWGGFPNNIDTTVAVSSGALAYGSRPPQAIFDAGYDCESAGTSQACVRTYDEWAPIQDNVDAVRDNTNCMHSPQSNKSGLGGVRIMDIAIDFGEDWGIPAQFHAFTKTRTIEEYSYQYGQYNPNTPVMQMILEGDVIPLVLEWIIDDPTFETAEAMPPGIPYELFTGGWSPTAETIYNHVSQEFPSSLDRGDVTLGAPHLWMPRHCFVPLISALDVFEEYLITKYNALINNWETWNGCNLFPTWALWRGEFSYADFVDYETIMWLSWRTLCNVWPPQSPGKMGAFSGEIKNGYWGRATNFDWVYFHEENLQHGEMNASAVEFIMDKITRTLSGELPRQPTSGYAPPPQNKVVMTVAGFQCEICMTLQGWPVCDNCGIRMEYSEAEDKFSCPCGNEAPYPTHCGQRMVPSFF